MSVAAQRAMTPVQKMLVPVDGSPPSIAALEHAVALAEDSTARIDVLHVDAPDDFAIGSSAPMSEGARAQVEHAMAAAIHDAEGRLADRIASRRVSGEPTRTILTTAKDGAYDLVVMGTHGRVGRLHAMLGSVAEAVVRNAPCPVLTVRDSSGEYQSFSERRHGRPAIGEGEREPRRGQRT